MIRKASFLLFTLCLLLEQTISVHAQQPGIPPFCQFQNVLCLRLFTAPEISITTITSLARQPIFQNPLLTVELKITVPSGTPSTIARIYLGDLWILNNKISNNTSPKYCNLLIGGLQDPATKQYADYVDFDLKTGSSFVVNLYAFCQQVNFPRIERDQPVPVTSDTIFISASGATLNNRLDNSWQPTKLQQLQALLTRAINGSCRAFPGATPLSLTSISTQIAVFIANKNPVPEDDDWKLYYQTANDHNFLRDYAAIYCLLADTDHQDPQLEPKLSANAVSGNVPLKVTFADESKGPVISSRMKIDKLGDNGAVQSLVPSGPFQPSYEFATEGDYEVTLTITGPDFTLNGGQPVPRSPASSSLKIHVDNPPPAITPTIPGITEQHFFSQYPWPLQNDLTLIGFIALLGGVIYGLVVLAAVLMGVRSRLGRIGLSGAVVILVVVLIWRLQQGR